MRQFSFLLRQYFIFRKYLIFQKSCICRLYFIFLQRRDSLYWAQVWIEFDPPPGMVPGVPGRWSLSLRWHERLVHHPRELSETFSMTLYELFHPFWQMFGKWHSKFAQLHWNFEVSWIQNAPISLKFPLKSHQIWNFSAEGFSNIVTNLANTRKTRIVQKKQCKKLPNSGYVARVFRIWPIWKFRFQCYSR